MTICEWVDRVQNALDVQKECQLETINMCFNRRDLVELRMFLKRIRELETKLKLNTELCEVFRNEISRLKATLKQADEAYDIQGSQLRKALEKQIWIRNELCVRCGRYKKSHLGACDGCVFKESDTE